MANFEFKPFDKVLVRNRRSMWIPAFYGMKSESKHLTSAGWQDECIPYEGNEEYLGTSSNYVDKVSKFKVGNWLVENEPNNYARFVQILDIVDIQGKKRYRVSRDIHNDEDIVEFRFIESYYHPFTLQDAKPGDILADDEGVIGMFQSLGSHPDGGYNNDDSYCLLNCRFEEDGFFYADFEHGNEMETSWHIHPATKEQRELLFQKMKEAGYEWDAEKKELKKIEQKPSAWSEEDERLFQIIIDTLDKEEHKGHLSHTDLIACVRKLKSLRPQNHWKPSDQELGAILAAIGDERQKGSDVAKELLKIYQQLKKLMEE